MIKDLTSKTENHKILIVEDELPFIKLLSGELIKRGYSICTASDGKEGYEEAKNHPHGLVLLDILMPVMDGITMYTKLREDPKTKNTEIILLTNLEPDDDIRHKIAGDDHVSYCIKSNTRLEELYKMIDRIMKA